MRGLRGLREASQHARGGLEPGTPRFSAAGQNRSNCREMPAKTTFAADAASALMCANCLLSLRIWAPRRRSVPNVGRPLTARSSLRDAAALIGILVRRVVGHHRVLGHRAARLRLVGRVPLGRFRRGHGRIHWNGRGPLASGAVSGHSARARAQWPCRGPRAPADDPGPLAAPPRRAPSGRQFTTHRRVPSAIRAQAPSVLVFTVPDSGLSCVCRLGNRSRARRVRVSRRSSTAEVASSAARRGRAGVLSTDLQMATQRED